MKSKLPLYQQVSHFLIDKINTQYKPGDLIPTQEEISRLTSTSLITVKRAIAELASEGYLKSIAGKGTFVKKPEIIDTHVGVSSWTKSIIAQGSLPGTSKSEVIEQPPSTEVYQALKLKSDEKTYVLKRLRTIDNKSACIMTNELPQHILRGFSLAQFNSESFYTWLEDQHGIVAARSEEEVYARAASQEEIEELKLEQPIVLVIKRISFFESGQPFELSTIIASAEQYRYHTTQVNRALDPEKITSIIKNQIK